MIGAAATLRAVAAARGASSSVATRMQGSGNYPGIDVFRDITLKKGTVIYGGYPGQSAFYTTSSAIRRAGDSASSLFQGLQVARHPVRGYRSNVAAYEVIEDVPAAFGRSIKSH